MPILKSDFIIQANKIFKNEFNYELLPEEFNKTQKINIICYEHGSFSQEARSHLKSYGCNKCSQKKRREKEINNTDINELENKFKEAHPDDAENYSYPNIKEEYQGKTSKITIKCNKCEREFKQKINKHLIGQGCNYCSSKRGGEKQRTDIDELENNFKEVHGENHSYPNIKEEYQGCDTPITIICNQCKRSFKQTPYHHKKSSGCPDCSIIKRGQHKCDSSRKKFWEQVQSPKFQNKFNFEKFEYKNAKTKGILLCKNCNQEFLISPNNLKRGKGCPNCLYKTINLIAEFLKEDGIIFEKEYNSEKWLQNSETSQYFRFDFKIGNIFLEVDGIQHIEPVKHFNRNKSFEEIRRRDLEKQKRANDNGYSVFRFYQPDVLYNQIDWKSILREIHVNQNSTIKNEYFSKEQVYESFKKEFNLFIQDLV